MAIQVSGITVAVAFAIILSLLFKVQSKSKRFQYPLPPSPKPLPLIGNLLDFPRSQHPRYFQKLNKELASPITSISALGQTWVNISDFNLGKEIMVRRSAINSSRLEFPYFTKYINRYKRYWGFETENDLWRRGKELTAVAMDFVRKGEAYGVQEMECRRTLFNLLEEKNGRWKDHIMRFGASVMTALAYGFSCPSIDFAPLVQLNSLSQRAANGILAFSIINFVPILDKIPGPMPWRVFTRAFLKEDKEFYEKIHDDAKAGQNVGAATWLKTIFAEKPEDAPLVDQLVAAGAETTGMSICTYLLAWCMFPEAMESVRAQVDAVCGSEFPSFKDREYLGLVDGCVAETLRWRPEVPLGIPHRSLVDQTITTEGGHTYTIPANAILTVNALDVDSDPKRFDQPARFWPERHLDNDGRFRHCELATFGWSKRRCPGAPFAEDSMFIIISSMLWAFDIHKVDGFDYQKIAYEHDFANEELVFPFTLTPRSAEKAKEIYRYDAQESTLPRN